MKIVFTSSYKTYFKYNTKNYVTNYYVLVFLISVIFFLLIIWDGGSIVLPPSQNKRVICNKILYKNN